MKNDAVQIAQGFVDVARNLWWSWTPRAQRLFERLDPAAWGESHQSALATIKALHPDGTFDTPEDADLAVIAAALSSKGLMEEAAAVVADFKAYIAAEDCWFKRSGSVGLGGAAGPVAYFSAEFGLHASLPIYSGGLGVLAGDHVKAASDLGLPFVALGLIYRQGYFQQRIDEEGSQQATYPPLDMSTFPGRLVRDKAGSLVVVTMPVGRHALKARIWRVDVGRVPLYLLDTDLPENDARARTITDHLYGGGTDLRIVQEILLGIGGVRAIRALGLDPAVWHLNEGHCAFLSLELLRERVAAGESLEAARAAVIARSIFTTHTPVPAGHDRFDADLVERRLGWMGEALGLSLDGLMALGRVGEVAAQVSLDLPEPVQASEIPGEEADGEEVDGEEVDGDLAGGDLAVEGNGAAPSLEARASRGLKAAPVVVEDEDEGESDEPLCMTVVALRLTRSANGVSMVHGEVSRQMWAAMWGDRAASDVPIGHVTNGIHLQTWCSPIARDHLDPHLPADWMERQDDPELWLDLVDGLTDAQIWAMRRDLKRQLVDFIGDRWGRRASRLLSGGETQGAPAFDPEVLTIGFARRFATYKRADLLFRDLDRAAALLNDAERPVQIVFAGKAHPKDTGGQALIRRLVEISELPDFLGRVVVLEDYDMIMGRQLVSGVDLWLNNPRKPREASGTSGQKVAIHGGLNLSVLDGWWPEGFDGSNGFAIGDATAPVDPDRQDDRDADALYSALQEQVLPLYYDRDADGRPRRWIRRVRLAMKTLVGRFTTYRMVKDYTRYFYL